MKGLIGRGGNASYPALNVSDKLITNNKDKASVFNNVFLSYSTIDTTNAHLQVHQIDPIRFDRTLATEAEVADQIKCIDNQKQRARME